ncbi:Pol protein [Phytophthora palmivora]|uniref:Pol protein n=1 Tax=Phytophthora palmivora TaxID=4796 RepID=A0A2P4XW52_9STRA|nr:Pol protein [Phytophthora palmivora]
MRVLAASLVGNPLPEHIKVTVFMDGLKVGPSRTQLFRVHANTMEEAIQIALQGEILIDSGASKIFARRQTVARNGDKYSDALRESEGRGQVSVRLADGTVVNVLGVRADLAVKFEDIDSTETFLVLEMEKYDLTLGIPWLEKHEPWIDWRGKTIGLAGLQSPTELCRRAVWASTVAVPDATDQAGNIGPQAAEAAEESAKGVSCVGNIGPQAAEAAGEDAKGASGVGNIVPRKVEETEKKIESAACVSSVGNRVPRGVKKTSTNAEVPLSTSRVDNQVPHSESETPPARPVEEQCHVFDGVSGRQVKAGAVHLEALPEVSALLNLEELSMKDFLTELRAGDIAEMVLLKPETSPEDLNSSSVMDEDVLEGFTKQRVIDAFFTKKAKSGMVRESKSPHSTPTFCVRKPNGKWRLVHAYNKPNNATTYFDDIFVQSRAEDGQTAMEVHLKHLRRVFEVMRANKLYANIDKCVFAAEEIRSSAALSAGSAYAPIQERSRP